MGYTFEVFPARAVEVELHALAARACEHLRRYVCELPIERLAPLSPALAAEARQRLARRAEAVAISFVPTATDPAPARLGIGMPVRPEALAFAVAPSDGGGVVQRLAFGKGQSRKSWWARELAPRLEARGLGTALEQAHRHGYHFEVVRTIGQPALAALAHGFVAAAIAELADGVIYSPDGAWDDEALPCDAGALVASYMRPAAATSERYRLAAEERQRALPAELGAFDADFVGRVREDILAQLVAEMNTCRGSGTAERAAFERALHRLETTRILSDDPSCDESDHLIGERRRSDAKPGAIDRLKPTPIEYERWMAHLGELLV